MLNRYSAVAVFLFGTATLLVLIHVTDLPIIGQTFHGVLLPKLYPLDSLIAVSSSRFSAVSSRYYVDSVKIDDKVRHFYNISYSPTLDEDLDNLKLEPIPYLSDYKNPCWYEKLPDEGPYLNEKNVLTTIFPNLKEHTEKAEEYYYNRNAPSPQLRIRCLPYYYIIGVSKCGSSDLNSIIKKHQGVIGPPKKEVTFWNRLRYTTPQLEQNPMILQRGKFLRTRDTWPLRHYMDVYDWNAIKIESSEIMESGEAYHDKITGDATPNYIWHFDGWRKVAANKGANEPKVILAHLIKELTPQAKIIVMIRDPIKRLWSEYNYFKKGMEKSAVLFHELVLEAIDVWDNCVVEHPPKYCVYDEWTNSQTFPVRLRLGLYYLFIQDWYEVFGDQFLLLKLEDYAESRSSVTDKIFDFLDLGRLPSEDINDEEVHNSNKNSKTTSMNPETEQILADFYKPWNEKLGKLMGNTAFDYNNL